jgi:hypothetical protein
MLRIQNVHTVAELNADARRCAGVRNLLTFDRAFDKSADRRVLKALLTRVFSVPRAAVKRVATARMQPAVGSSISELQGELQALEAETAAAAADDATASNDEDGDGEAGSNGDEEGEEEGEEEEDEEEGEAPAAAPAKASKQRQAPPAAVERVKHVFSFMWLDDRIWVRVYRIGRGPRGKMDVEEIGPRMTLEPVRIIASGFGGAILSTNENRRKGDDSDEGD